jgi:methylenetetrahydrofolate--tRNA-(uracil-5-)-methyltransferase
MNKEKTVIVIGAGLAGCEAAYQLAKRGVKVKLYEMRPTKSTGAHKTEMFAELVCSNSLRSDSLKNAVGVLKEELRIMDSLIMKVADESSVPAGSSLAVDRDLFAKRVTEAILSEPDIEVIREEIIEIPTDYPVIIATGPLTSDNLSQKIIGLLDQKSLYFYDAAAPIIEKDSIDFSKAYIKSRYQDEGGDYINCPMDKNDFFNFYKELIIAETAPLKDVEKEKYFEGCMPFEEIAKRGFKTLLFGPMKPVGLEKDGKTPYAVVQLRQDNSAASLYNVVGFQTHLKWGEQKRILQMVPGLENCNIVRYGVMHRNTYINSPECLNPTYQSKIRDDLFFAGQLTGVEGYIESCASGMLAGINMARYVNNIELKVFPKNTMIGAMANYICTASKKNFQPMNANFGIFRLDKKYPKDIKKEMYAKESLPQIVEFMK